MVVGGKYSFLKIKTVSESVNSNEFQCGRR
jgi:hypothetical protein